jgi:hypothetical protein
MRTAADQAATLSLFPQHSCPSVLAGAASRLTPKLEPLERTYSGTLKLGAATTTYDATGQVTTTSPWRHISDDDLAAAATKFQGEVLQVPCMWSSTKYKNRVGCCELLTLWALAHWAAFAGI